MTWAPSITNFGRKYGVEEKAPFGKINNANQEQNVKIDFSYYKRNIVEKWIKKSTKWISI